MGSGHVMRCLTLADELRNKGHDITFICRELPGNLISLIKDKGYVACQLNWQGDGNDFDWSKDVSETINVIETKNVAIDLLVVDHYQLDSRWESEIRHYTKKILVIDDLADRKHNCDFLLDQNYYANLAIRYDGLLSTKTIKLLGPQFSLLRPQFYQARKVLSERSGEINNILIFMGGGDSFNLTAVAIRAIQLIEKKINLRVVIGATNPHYAEIEALCATLKNTKLYIQVESMAELMVWADLAIGAGGATTWERCYLGLPSITLVFAENQLETTVDLAAIGVTSFLGWAHECSDTYIASAVQKTIDSPMKMKEMGCKAMDLMTKDMGGTSGPVGVLDALSQ